jgi:phosphonoacetate hydrolase
LSSQRDPVRLIFMVDGLGLDYFSASTMPFVSALAAEGELSEVEGLWPTVTNVNNAAIACAAPPCLTGITGNSVYDPSTGAEQYMDRAVMLKQPTVLERWGEIGRTCALLTSKGKSERLLGRGLALTVSGQAPKPEVVQAVGEPPDIYSPDINHWLLKCLRWALRSHPEIDTYYVHTTDYPMHMWEPGDPRSDAHLVALDNGIREACKLAGEFELFVSADHGMNFKSYAVDLGRVLERQAIAGAKALCVEKDGLVAHHRDLGGSAWIFVDGVDVDRAREAIGNTPGVEMVLGREEAAERFSLDPERIGDLAVFAGPGWVFGQLSAEQEELAPTYRSHGSLYEMAVPLVRWGAQGTVPATANWHLLCGVDGAPGPLGPGNAGGQSTPRSGRLDAASELVEGVA